MNTLKTKAPVSIYERIQQLLDQNHPQEALNLINHVNSDSPPMKNAQGVCLLRLGRAEDAVSVLRGIVFQGYICIPSDTPVVYKTNFVTAMLMANHKESVMGVIEDLDEGQHPAVARLKAAMRNWFKSLSLFQRLLSKVRIYSRKPVSIDFPPGDLE